MSTVKIQSNIAISDSGFLFNPATGESYSVNPIGLEIIALIREGKNETEICNIISQKYESEQVIVERDLHDFVHMLRQYQLLDNNGGQNN